MPPNNTPPNHQKYNRRIGMGELDVMRGAGVLRTLLGSCIGLVLYDRQNVVGGLAHIVHPDSAGRSGPPGKYADTALAELLKLIEQKGGRQRNLTARYAGGSNMFGTTQLNQIGQMNIAAVARLLKTLCIPVLATDCGGGKGRQLSFDVATGDVSVEVLGGTPASL
ncbi:MAG: Chemoreceptor glutamine deamidase CheD [Planctomycetota bacterium]|jgi:chemotaxis protein CheD